MKIVGGDACVLLWRWWLCICLCICLYVVNEWNAFGKHVRQWIEVNLVVTVNCLLKFCLFFEEGACVFKCFFRCI